MQKKYVTSSDYLKQFKSKHHQWFKDKMQIVKLSTTHWRTRLFTL